MFYFSIHLIRHSIDFIYRITVNPSNKYSLLEVHHSIRNVLPRIHYLDLIVMEFILPKLTHQSIVMCFFPKMSWNIIFKRTSINDIMSRKTGLSMTSVIIIHYLPNPNYWRSTYSFRFCFVCRCR